MNPGHVDVHSVAKVDRRVEQALVRRGGPEIQMVSVRATEETAVVLLREIRRKRPLSPVATMTNWTIAVHLLPPSGGRDKSQEFEDLWQGHHRSHSLKIDARHRIIRKQEKRQPVLVR
jgi:hypothetical protein